MNNRINGTSVFGPNTCYNYIITLKKTQLFNMNDYIKIWLFGTKKKSKSKSEIEKKILMAKIMEKIKRETEE